MTQPNRRPDRTRTALRRPSGTGRVLAAGSTGSVALHPWQFSVAPPGRDRPTRTSAAPESSPSTDYHDYVFGAGKLVGDFEGMYRHSAEVPWHQDKTAFDISADLDIAILARRRYGSICDVGAGLGHFTQRLRSELRADDGASPTVSGFDISPTAVAEASCRWPCILFMQADLLSDAWRPPTDRFDLVVAKDILWYVCQRLDVFLGRLVELVSTGSARAGEDGGNGSDGGGWLHISQSFPASDDWVGRDIIPSHDALLEHVRRFVEIEYHCSERDARWGGGSALHILGRPSRSFKTS